MSQESRDFPLSGFPHRAAALQSSGSPSPENPTESCLLRTWLEYEAESQSGHEATSNGAKLLGILLVFGLSGVFWTGVGLLVERLLK